VLLGFETGSYTIEDCERILELGLIGSGLDEREADKLLDAHVRTQPIAENAGTAAALLAALYIGKPHDNARA
jgi:NaMN:DMB phosphoribosyltransferase